MNILSVAGKPTQFSVEFDEPITVVVSDANDSHMMEEVIGVSIGCHNGHITVSTRKKRKTFNYAGLYCNVADNKNMLSVRVDEIYRVDESTPYPSW